jgi:hypothetical protein
VLPSRSSFYNTTKIQPHYLPAVTDLFLSFTDFQISRFITFFFWRR